eukprot:m.105110 g.105110  ORF g.105110 m.105110 type:complete len:111 (-) comp13271_c0_seq2:2113-2445(-)
MTQLLSLSRVRPKQKLWNGLSSSTPKSCELNLILPISLLNLPPSCTVQVLLNDTIALFRISLCSFFSLLNVLFHLNSLAPLAPPLVLFVTPLIKDYQRVTCLVLLVIGCV